MGIGIPVEDRNPPALPVLAGLATYAACGTGYTAYATPTDMVTISGVTGKIVRVLGARMAVNTTATGIQAFYYIKRATANAGGTLTNPTGIPIDADDPGHGAVITLYTAAPTVGVVVGNIAIHTINTTAPTTAPGVTTLTSAFNAGFSGPNTPLNFLKPVILRGPDQCLAINLQGAALVSGFTATWDFLWTESPT